MTWPDDIRPLTNGWTFDIDMLIDADGDGYEPGDELTVQQVVQLRGCGQTSVKREIAKGKLPAIKRKQSDKRFLYIIKAADAVRAKEPPKRPVVGPEARQKLSDAAKARRAANGGRRF